MKTAVIYWSGTGNTEAMAEAVVKGIASGGGEAFMFQASQFDASMMSRFDSFAFGCPSMGSEELEDIEFAPMFQQCEEQLAGKNIALFGSYGWGGGEWMENWKERCAQLGALLVCDSVICNGTPDTDALAACTAMGLALSKAD